MFINEEQNSVIQQLDIAKQKLISLRDTIDSNISNLQIKNISERRSFFQSLATIVAALLGLNPLLLENQVNPEVIIYFYISTGLYILLIIIIMSYLGEVYDNEDLGLNLTKKQYNLLIKNALDLNEKYQNKEFTYKNLDLYNREKGQIKGIDGLLDDYKKLQTTWISKKPIFLNYVRELFMFLFVLAIIFTSMSIFLEKIIGWHWIILIVIFVYIISTINYSSKIIYIFSWWPNWIKNIKK